MRPTIPHAIFCCKLALFLMILLITAAGPVRAKLDGIQIQVLQAAPGGLVKVRVSNQSGSAKCLWRQACSWGWDNWTFEFVEGNRLEVFVRNPNEAFIKNGPMHLAIRAHSSTDISFDLGDHSWVAEIIPTWVAYPDAELKQDSIHGCFAILSIPSSKDAKRFNVPTGTVISGLR